MELKLILEPSAGSGNIGSNRTFMELKCVLIYPFINLVQSSNRTFMELKWHVDEGECVCLKF